MPTLARTTVEWALQHLATHFDTDIFPKAFEFDAMHHARDEIAAYVARQDISQWKVRPLRRCLVPKQRFGFRLATQLDPLDMLFYFSLFLETAESIERARLPPNVNVSFSHRFQRDDTRHLVFDRRVGYPQFQAHSRQLAANASHVVVTDIADFYPRLYLHRLENALITALPSMPSHATALIRLVKAWNQNVSYGIPVGNNPSHLLAELAIDDVDRLLLSEGVTFCRYLDDFRLFCTSREDAHRTLAFLASTLFDMHGLTLQSHKTRILSRDRFLTEIIDPESRRELSHLSQEFRNILEQIGLDDPYEVLEFDDLPEKVQEAITALNLASLLKETLSADEYDIPMARFLLNRLSWLQTEEAVDTVVSHVDELYPLLGEAIRYLASLTDALPEASRHTIGATLLDKLQGSVLSQLEYNRMLILGLFSGSSKWGNAAKLPSLYILGPDNWFRRTLILALGKNAQDYWIRAKKTQVEQMPPWERRAFLYAASALPADERRNWYRAMRPRLDALEKSVVDWAEANPIST